MGRTGLETTLVMKNFSQSGLRGLSRPPCTLPICRTRSIFIRQGLRRVIDKTVQTLFGSITVVDGIRVTIDDIRGRSSTVKSFEDILHDSADPDMRMIMLDDSALPAPVSSFEHVARSTASRESLVPPKVLWPFGLRIHPHRQAS